MMRVGCAVGVAVGGDSGAHIDAIVLTRGAIAVPWDAVSE